MNLDVDLSESQKENLIPENTGSFLNAIPADNILKSESGLRNMETMESNLEAKSSDYGELKSDDDVISIQTNPQSTTSTKAIHKLSIDSEVLQGTTTDPYAKSIDKEEQSRSLSSVNILAKKSIGGTTTESGISTRAIHLNTSNKSMTNDGESISSIPISKSDKSIKTADAANSIYIPESSPLPTDIPVEWDIPGPLITVSVPNDDHPKNIEGDQASYTEDDQTNNTETNQAYTTNDPTTALHQLSSTHSKVQDSMEIINFSSTNLARRIKDPLDVSAPESLEAIEVWKWEMSTSKDLLDQEEVILGIERRLKGEHQISSSHLRAERSIRGV